MGGPQPAGAPALQEEAPTCPAAPAAPGRRGCGRSGCRSARGRSPCRSGTRPPSRLPLRGSWRGQTGTPGGGSAGGRAPCRAPLERERAHRHQRRVSSWVSLSPLRAPASGGSRMRTSPPLATPVTTARPRWPAGASAHRLGPRGHPGSQGRCLSPTCCGESSTDHSSPRGPGRLRPGENPRSATNALMGPDEVPSDLNFPT